MYWVKYQLVSRKWKCRLFYTHEAAYNFVTYHRARHELNGLEFDYQLHLDQHIQLQGGMIRFDHRADSGHIVPRIHANQQHA